MKYVLILALCLTGGIKCMAQDSTLQHADNPAHPPGGDIPAVHYRPSWTGQPDKYCATLMGGRLVVVYKGKPIVEFQTLGNGTRLMRDGTLILPDGTRKQLKDKSCIDGNGNEDM